MIRELMLPRFIFKYRKLDSTFYEIFEKRELWFSSPLEFNDPFDCNVCWDFDTKAYTRVDIERFVRSSAKKDQSEKSIKETIERLVDNPETLREAFEGLKNVIQQSGISCFSADGNNALMWSHYADAHKGVMIAFRTDVLMAEDFQFHNVLYSNEPPQVDFLKNHNDAIYKIIEAKSDKWAYEKEFRLMTIKKGATPFPPQSFLEVYFGVNVSETDIIRAIEFITNQGTVFRHMAFHRMVKSKKSFEIHSEHIPFITKDKIGRYVDS